MAVAVPTQPTPTQALTLGMKYGPNSGLAIQRSQYLADALQSLQQSAQDNIRTPTALWTNLLADGILQWGKHRADKQAMDAFSTDRAAQAKADLDGVGSPDAGPPAVPPAQAAPGAPPTGPADPPPAVASAAPVQIGGAPQATPDPALVKMMLTEAGGEGDAGMRAVGHVALNRVDKGYGGAKSLADVLSAPHQFNVDSPNSAIPPDNPRYQHAAALAAALSGEPDPTNGATQFLNPELTQRLYGHIPAWAQGGDGQRIGHHVFFGGAPQVAANQGLADAINAAHQLPPGALAGGGHPQGAGPGPMPPQFGQLAYTPPTPDQGAQPYRVAANGPTPPPPTVAMGVPPPPAAATPQAGAPPAAPTSPGQPAAGGVAPPVAAPYPVAPPRPQGVPTGLAATPQERALIQRLESDPRTFDQGHALSLEIQRRMAEPVPMKPGTYWGADGKPHAVEQFQDQPGSPNAFTQRSNLDNSVHTQANPAFGALPAGTQMSPQGSISQVPIAQQPTFKIPNVNGVFVNGPDGRPVKVGDDQYGPEQLLKMRDNLLGSEPVKNYQQAADAYGSMVAAAKQNPGGMRAYALRDTFARAINPGAVARVGTIQAIKESQGLPAEIKGFFMNLHGDGNVPPEIAQQILDVTQGFVASHYHGAQQLVQSNADYARRHQIDPADVTVPLGDAPQRFLIPPPQALQSPGGAPSPSPAGMAPGMGPQPVPVRTPEEARRLPHGTPIRLPDGSIGRVP